MIPVSTALFDPDWYRPSEGQEYFYDKRGIVCGLRYEPLIVQREAPSLCPCGELDWKERAPACPAMIEYSYLLSSFVDKERTLQAFEYCAEKFKRELNLPCEPIIVLMVYEAPTNPCSERWALQKFFNCKELRYPIC